MKMIESLYMVQMQEDKKVYRHFLTTRLGFEEILDPYWGRCLAKNL